MTVASPIELRTGQQPAARTKKLAAPASRTVPWQAWLAILAAWMVWGTINVLRLGSSPFLTWNQAFWYGFPDALIWAGFTPFVIAISRRYPVVRPRGWSSLGFHLLAATAFALLHAATDATVAAGRAMVVGRQPEWELVFFKVLGHGFHTNALVYLLVAGLAQYLAWSRRQAHAEQQAAQLRARLAEAQLASLERQLRPHFLFNALNTIAGLMGRDPQRGQQVVRRLGDLLRASLARGPGQRIPLAEELSLARAYLGIEQVRFGDRLQVEIDDVLDDRDGNFPVPALILQPLVENAVTHGVSQRPQGGRIRISVTVDAETATVEVVDDGIGIGRAATPSGFGVGLGNTRARLEAMYGEDAELQVTPADPEGGGTCARVTLPASAAGAMSAGSALRALVVDDEPVARDLMCDLLRAVPDVQVAGTCSNGDEALAWLGRDRADVVFLDIHMPGLDGFDVLASLQDHAPMVVFVTADQEHAVRAFEIEALDYLLKPIDAERLEQSLERVRRGRRAPTTSVDSGESVLERLALPHGRGRTLVRLTDVWWLQAESNYVRFHLATASYLARAALRRLEPRLDPRRFVRIHRATIVNVDRIARLEPSGHGDLLLTLEDGRALALSRRYRDRLERVLELLS